MNGRIEIRSDLAQNFTSIDTCSFFQLILENAGETCILLMDENGNILATNLAVKTAFGYSEADLAGKNFSTLFTEEDQKKGLPKVEIQQVCAVGTATDRNYIVHQNGTPIWVHGESVLVKDSNGKSFIVKMIYNINEQKLLERSLYEANEDLNTIKEDLKKKNLILESVNKDLDTFVYTASHDLKAPLHNLQALISELIAELSQKSREKEDVQETINMINQSLENFTKTINELAKSGRTKAEIEEGSPWVNIEESMKEVKVNLKRLEQENQAKIIEDFSQAPEVKLPRKDLKSILYNLVSNAIKYRSKERNPIVNVSSERVDENLVLLKVEDNGTGLKEEDKLRLFTIYQRFHPEVEGTGVGLSIVKKIVENNGGKIEVETELGKGTSFRILLNS